MTARFDFTAVRPAEQPGRWRMPDWMRREIDARVAAGAVTRCPPMTFAAPEWAPASDPGVTAVEVAPGKVVTAGGGWRGERPGVAERRAAILKLADGTRTMAEIAAAVSAPAETVRNDLSRLRAQGHEARVRRAAPASAPASAPAVAPAAKRKPAGPAPDCGPRGSLPFRLHRTVAELGE